MPRVKQLSANRKGLKTAILKRLVDLDKDRAWLSDYTGIKYRTLNSKLENGNFTFEELWIIFQATKMPTEIIIELLGRGNG